MRDFGKLTLVLLLMWFMPLMISYLTYVVRKWIGGGPVSLESSWICVPRHEDMLSLLFPLASYIVLTDLESR